MLYSGARRRDASQALWRHCRFRTASFVIQVAGITQSHPSELGSAKSFC